MTCSTARLAEFPPAPPFINVAGSDSGAASTGMGKDETSGGHASRRGHNIDGRGERGQNKGTLVIFFCFWVRSGCGESPMVLNSAFSVLNNGIMLLMP